MRALGVLAAIATCFGMTAHASDSMRCGRWVVDSSMDPAELLAKCGEPDSKRVEESDVRTRTVSGGMAKIGTQITEYWTYKRGPQGLDMLVVIVDGKIRSIGRAE